MAKFVDLDFVVGTEFRKLLVEAGYIRPEATRVSIELAEDDGLNIAMQYPEGFTLLGSRLDKSAARYPCQ